MTRCLADRGPVWSCGFRRGAWPILLGAEPCTVDDAGQYSVDAAAWHSPSLVLTSDPEDLLAYRKVLDTHQVEIISVT